MENEAKLKKDIAKFIDALDRFAADSDFYEDWLEAIEQAAVGTDIDLPVRKYVISGTIGFDFSFVAEGTSEDKTYEMANKLISKKVKKAIASIKLSSFEATGIDIYAYGIELE